MEARPIKEFNKSLNWSTRIYTLAAVATVVLAFLFNAWTTNFVMTIFGVVAIVFLVEAFVISVHRHPKTWNIIKWIALLATISLLFLGTS
jgi:hypothetical protein